MTQPRAAGSGGTGGTRLRTPALALGRRRRWSSPPIEHHVYPSVPCFNLKALHEHIAKHPDYQHYAHIAHGYRGLLAEVRGVSLAKPRPNPSL